MHKDVCIEIRSDPALLRLARGIVRGYLDACLLSSDKIMEVVLAVDEACTNAMRHSYGGACEGRLKLSLGPYRDGIEIVLQDKGAPAPADKVCRKAVVTPDIESLKPGGLGVGILYEVFDEVVFVPGAERGNRVRMRLKCPRQPE